MFDRTKLQAALDLCLKAVLDPQEPVLNFFVYLDHINCRVSPRDLKLLFEQHPECVAGALDAAMLRQSFGQFGMAITRPPVVLAAFSPLLTVKVVGKAGTIPPRAEPMALAFLDNGGLKTRYAPTRERLELWA